jgi:hypothetical protein
LYHRATISLKQAAFYGYAMIQKIGCANTKVRLDRTGFLITRAVYQPSDARVNHRSCTHRARLDGRVQGCAREPVIALGASGCAHRHDLGVRRRVARSDDGIATVTAHLIINHDDGPDRYFASVASGFGFQQRQPHKFFVA